jgi:DNA-binding MarR family transcriptional regulator
LNLSHQAIRLLQHIEKSNDITIGVLAKHLKVSQNTASEHTKRLIKKGFVIKKRSNQDERKVFVILSEEGREVLNRHTQLDKKKLKKVLEHLSAHDVEMIQKTFSLLSEESKNCF